MLHKTPVEPVPENNLWWLWGRMSLRFRARRMDAFVRAFHINRATNVIDVGGTERNWHLTAAEPAVLLVNIAGEEYERGRFVRERGDGTTLPYASKTFDVAYSNSVIEHLGTFERQQAFAHEIRRVAPRYYVQTPYKWFLAEPHFLALCIHWLPKPVYRRLLRWLSLWGWIHRPSQQDVDAQLAEIRLLTVAEMRQLFPDGELVRERFFGLTKSLIMVRR